MYACCLWPYGKRHLKRKLISIFFYCKLCITVCDFWIAVHICSTHTHSHTQSRNSLRFFLMPNEEKQILN